MFLTFASCRVAELENGTRAMFVNVESLFSKSFFRLFWLTLPCVISDYREGKTRQEERRKGDEEKEEKWKTLAGDAIFNV